MPDIFLPSGPGYLIVQGLHIASALVWMGSMIVLLRVFVQHHGVEAGSQSDQALSKLETGLSRGLITPAMIATWALAIAIIALNPSLLASGWLHIKLVLVIALSGLHGVAVSAIRKFVAGDRPYSPGIWIQLHRLTLAAAFVVVLVAVTKPFS